MADVENAAVGFETRGCVLSGEGGVHLKLGS